MSADSDVAPHMIELGERTLASGMHSRQPWRTVSRGHSSSPPTIAIVVPITIVPLITALPRSVHATLRPGWAERLRGFASIGMSLA